MPAWRVEDQRFRQLLGACHEVVKPAGFSSPAQVGQTSRETAAVFCGDPDVFAERHAVLMPDYGPEGAGCVDVWIHVDWEEGRVWASVEATYVAGWLRERGLMAEAEAMERAPRLTEAMAAVTEGLARMLGTTGG